MTRRATCTTRGWSPAKWRAAGLAAAVFVMGCSPGDSRCFYSENPPHEVTITKGFWMGETPVTVGAYQRFADAAGAAMDSQWEDGVDDLPVAIVSWHEAAACCR